MAVEVVAVKNHRLEVSLALSQHFIVVTGWLKKPVEQAVQEGSKLAAIPKPEAFNEEGAQKDSLVH